MGILQDIAGLIEQATHEQLIEANDQIYVRNQVLSKLNIHSYNDNLSNITKDTIPNMLEKITCYAILEGIIENTLEAKDQFSADIMNCFIARPSVINNKFNQKYLQSPVEATNYFYHLNKSSNYIQMNRIKQNIHFQVESLYGNLDITINLSKPEKDSKQIKRESELKQTTNYPKCVLCIENEGYAGRIGYPARANHRVIKIPINNENWYLQYSPYIYYNEHSILLAEQHRPMKISEKTFTNLLLFVEMFPHYFIGSNADLPIVGGSILSHDHYQAGQYEFAITKADTIFSFKLLQFPAVSAAVLNWPMSIIRLRSVNKTELIKAANHIYMTWKQYKDDSADIIPFTNKTPHNTVTPIARFCDDKFELDIVLRNNRTSKDYPLGIFHPHADVHHIKKENIGLIEVMGLAVLPARLKAELDEIKKFLLDDKQTIADHHQTWAMQLKKEYGTIVDWKKSEAIIKHELGKKYLNILDDAAVFKRTELGESAFKQFITSLNHIEGLANE